MSFYYIGSFLVPFLISLILIPLVRRLALRVGFVDLPSKRKIHRDPVPLGGGLAVFIAFMAVNLALLSSMSFGDAKSAVGIIAGGVLIFLIGLYDDVYEMGVVPKMMGQIVAAIIFLSFLEKTSSIISLPVFLIFGLIWIVSIQNAMNFLDNMDGLCGGVAMSIAIGLGFLFVLKDMPIFAIMSFALAGGALGFLRYNLPPAIIFLGDTGSLLVGYVLSCLAIIHLNTSKGMADALSPLLIMAYPIFDLTFVTVSRLGEGRKVYVGGKDHSSHKINFMGLNKLTTVFLILSLNLVLICLGVLLFYISESTYQTLIVTVLAFVLAFTGTHLYKNLLFLRRRILLLVLDVLSINISIILYVFIRQTLLAQSLQVASPGDLAIPAAWITIYWIIIFAAGGIYDIPPELKFRTQFFATLRLTLLSSGIFLVGSYRFEQGFQLSPASVGLFSAALITVNATIRGIHHAVTTSMIRSGRRRQDTLVVRLGGPDAGCGDVIDMLAPYYGIKGYVGESGKYPVDYLGPSAAMGDILRDRRIARVILDIPSNYGGNLRPIFSSAFFMDTRFFVDRGAAAALRGLRKFETCIDKYSLVSINNRKMFPRISKRLFDFSFALILLALLSPWLLLRIILTRTGKIKPPAEVKIMGVADSERKIRCKFEKSGAYKFINIWGLLAVLKGDLSLVGTTITTVDEFQLRNQLIPGFWRKFVAKPGLIGPGYRGKDVLEQFDDDLKYAENSSFLYDLYIIMLQLTGLQTIRKHEAAQDARSEIR